MFVLGSAVTLGIVFRNTAHPEEESLRNDPIQVYKEPVPVKLSKTDRALALDTALKFVNTAVARRHVEDSYALAAPDLRAGLTRSQWARGEIPVIPYPATEARVRVDYSFRNELGLTLLLVPTPASKMNPMSFNMDMTARGNGVERRWLVSSWTPSGAPAAATVGGGGGGGGGGSSAARTSPRRTLRGWTRRSVRAGSSRPSRSSARSCSCRSSSASAAGARTAAPGATMKPCAR